MSRALLFITLTLVGVGCAAGLPRTRPPDFSVERTTGGGMRPESSGFRCSATECVADVQVDSERSEVRFVPPPAELDRLYGVLREHRVDRISVRLEEEVHDRGGTRIRVVAGGETYDVSNHGNSFVTDVEDWNAIEDALGSLERRLTDAVAVEVEITLSEALATVDARISFDGSDSASRTAIGSGEDARRRIARLAPGSHVIVVGTRLARGVATIDVGERRSFRVDLRGETLVVE